mgnify:CR=1 FL=1
MIVSVVITNHFYYLILIFTLISVYISKREEKNYKEQGNYEKNYFIYPQNHWEMRPSMRWGPQNKAKQTNL